MEEVREETGRRWEKEERDKVEILRRADGSVKMVTVRVCIQRVHGFQRQVAHENFNGDNHQAKRRSTLSPIPDNTHFRAYLIKVGGVKHAQQKGKTGIEAGNRETHRCWPDDDA